MVAGGPPGTYRELDDRARRLAHTPAPRVVSAPATMWGSSFSTAPSTSRACGSLQDQGFCPQQRNYPYVAPRLAHCSTRRPRPHPPLAVVVPGSSNPASLRSGPGPTPAANPGRRRETVRGGAAYRASATRTQIFPRRRVTDGTSRTRARATTIYCAYKGRHQGHAPKEYSAATRNIFLAAQGGGDRSGRLTSSTAETGGRLAIPFDGSPGHPSFSG